MSTPAATSTPAGVTPDVRVARGAASEEELAAILAVVSEAYTAEATQAVAEERRVSAWERTQRGLRKPLRRDIGWGRFAG